jgi:hypothetical protein
MMVTERRNDSDGTTDTLLAIREYPSFRVLYELQVGSLLNAEYFSI